MSSSHSPSGFCAAGVSRASGAGLRPWVVGVLVAGLCVLLNFIQNRHGIGARHYELGGEYINIAFALREGRGFADPFAAGTGATGWMPPCFVVILWGVNLLTLPGDAYFSGWFMPVLIGLKCAAFGAIAGMGWAILRDWRAGRVYRFAFLAAWAVLIVWAQWEILVEAMHDGWWLAFLVMFCFYGLVRLRSGRTRGVLSAAMCLAVFSSPVLFAAMFVPLGVRSLVFWRRGRRAFWRAGVRPVLQAVVLSCVCFAGWSVYLHATTGIWAPGKTNGGFELWQSLEQTDNGVPTLSTFALHPFSEERAREEYRRLGEKAFTEKYTREAWRVLRENPGRFLRHVANRAANATLRLDRTFDTLLFAQEIPAGISAELGRAGLLVPQTKSHQNVLRFLSRGDAEREKLIAGLSPEAAGFMRQAWQYFDQDEAAKPWWVRARLPELALSGLVTLAWIIAFRMASPRMKRRLGPVFWLYAGILAPYILISHYYRYQEPLAGLQILALAVAAGAVIEAWRRRVRRVDGCRPAGS